MNKIYYVFVLYLLFLIERCVGYSNWETLQPSGPIPSGRLFHTSVIYYDEEKGEDIMIMFGGRQFYRPGPTQYTDRLNDLWKYSIQRNEWTQVYGLTDPTFATTTNVNLLDGTTSECYAFRVMSHSAIITPNGYMLLYGGSYTVRADYDDELNTVWYYNLKTDRFDKNVSNNPFPYTENTTNNIYGPRELRRKRHSAVYSPLQDAMVVFGGVDDQDYDPSVSAANATWKYFIKEERWERVDAIGPAGRVNHGAAIDSSGRYMYICGGGDRSYIQNVGNLNDFWRLDIITNEWQELPLMDFAPQGLEMVLLTENMLWLSPWNFERDGKWSSQYWYDIMKGEWIEEKSKGDVPIGRVEMTLVSKGMDIYVWGGSIEAALREYPTEMIKMEYKKAKNYLPLIIGITVPVGVIILAVAGFFATKAFRAYRRNKYLTMDASSVELMSHLTITDVTVGAQIGGGNFGSVFKGVWQGTTPVACKKLKATGESVNFMREANTLRSLNHPNIVQFLGIFDSSSFDRYIVTEYLSMGNLSKVLLEGKLSEIELLEMCLQIVAGMLYLSEKGLVHRDLALRNFVVTVKEGKYIVKITDFGMSQKVDASGTFKSYAKDVPIKWSAPEAISNGDYTEKSDIWSFGVAMWEIFSGGALPYPDISNEDVVGKIVSGYRLPAPNGCDTEVYEIMLRCWTLEVEKRPNFKEVFESINKLLNQRKGTEQSQGQIPESRVYMGSAIFVREDRTYEATA